MCARQSYAFFGLGILLTAIASVQSAPVSATNEAEIFLSTFGYLPTSNQDPAYSELIDVAPIDANTLLKAIQDFQSFAGLNVTGELNDETIQMMAKPRCGVPDKVHTDDNMSNYVTSGSKWNSMDLTYRISKYSKRLRRADVDTEVANAFMVWSEYTDLTFTPKSEGPVNIDIRFEEGNHDCDSPFDGAGNGMFNTLAHAFNPGVGNTHFDDAEQWTIKSPIGTNFFQVAAHEFGHALGLQHSRVKSSLMAPIYSKYQPVFRLDNDDILGIQAIYGTKSTKPTGGNYPITTQRPAVAPPRAPQLATICEDSKIDTTIVSANGQIYAFKGNNFYIVHERYPKLISEGWPGLPADIDAGFTYLNGRTYFFKGTEYWVYNGRQMDVGHPKKISLNFPGVPDHLDAAMAWADGKIFFFKDSNYWFYNPMARPPISSDYPQPISNWGVMANSIDAAFQYNSYIYFFKGTEFYQYGVINGYPLVPHSTAQHWFACQKTPATGTTTVTTTVTPYWRFYIIY